MNLMCGEIHPYNFLPPHTEATRETSEKKSSRKKKAYNTQTVFTMF